MLWHSWSRRHKHQLKLSPKRRRQYLIEICRIKDREGGVGKRRDRRIDRKIIHYSFVSRIGSETLAEIRGARTYRKRFGPFVRFVIWCVSRKMRWDNSIGNDVDGVDIEVTRCGVAHNGLPHISRAHENFEMCSLFAEIARQRMPSNAYIVGQ